MPSINVYDLDNDKYVPIPVSIPLWDKVRNKPFESIDNDTLVVTDGVLSANASSGTTDYSELENKPKINGVTLEEDKTLADLGIDIPDTYTKIEIDNKDETISEILSSHTSNTTVHVTSEEKTAWDGKQDALTFNTAYSISNKVATMADVPDELADLTEDSMHRLVTDVEKSAWDAKQDALAFNTAYNASTNKAATMSDINSAISGVIQFDYEVVESLPATGAKGKIYLVANSGSGANIYDEYIYINSKFELLGTTQLDISGKQDKATAVTHVASTAVGSATQPVYIDESGVATVTTYSLEKSVPSDAVFTDTTYNVASSATNGLMSAEDKNKLDNISVEAEVNVQADWSVTDIDSDAYIKNKPDLGTQFTYTLDGTILYVTTK